MILNGLWLVIFCSDSTTGFVLGLIDITGMVITQIYMMQKSTRAKINTIEFISIRCGITIYTGWVTAATILGVTYVLQCFGMDTNESTWAVNILYIALFIYVLASFMERNPLYGAVYIWVLIAIN